MSTVSVHWTLGVKSPVQRKIREMAAPGSADAKAISRIRLSWLSLGSRGLVPAIMQMLNAER